MVSIASVLRAAASAPVSYLPVTSVTVTPSLRPEPPVVVPVFFDALYPALKAGTYAATAVVHTISMTNNKVNTFLFFIVEPPEKIYPVPKGRIG